MTAPAWTPHQEEIGGQSLAWRAAGEGPSVVYLHDAGADTVASPLFDDLATDHRVVVLDLPGYGRSPLAEDIDTPAKMTALLAAFAAAHNLAPGVVVGSSLGGWFAAELAAAAPSSVTGLVLIGAAGLHTPHSYLFDLFAAGATASATSHLVAAALLGRVPAGERTHTVVPGAAAAALVGPWIADLAAAAAMSWSPAVANAGLLGRLQRVTARTVVLWGERDALIPLAHGRAFACALRHARLEVVPGAGHLLALERPDRVAATVRSLTLAPAGSV